MQSPIRDGASLPEATQVLAICAHPDDIESWCGGTLALLSERGCTVELAICTAGEKGSADRAATVEHVAATRLREQREAADLLGISRMRFLGGRDGELEDNMAFRCQIVRLLRDARPGIVFTHDPEHPYPPYITHRDHRVVGRVVLDAVYPMARDHLYFPEQVREGLEPHAVSQVWLFSSMAATTAVDISSTLDRKIAARLAHHSQTRDPQALRVSWRERAAAIGAPCGLAAAEMFVVVEIGDG
jgi:LmbE family N-acetylglucosaminyl deacetylase